MSDLSAYPTVKKVGGLPVRKPATAYRNRVMEPDCLTGAPW
jgi:hypothetical protein